MNKNEIGKSSPRWDAKSKVSGKARFTDDFHFKNLLYGKIVRSTITHGKVLSYDISEAEKVDGVVKILLPKDISQNKYSTAGHPWSLEEKKGDVQDRTILTEDIRQYGDEIAAVIAKNQVAAERAAEKIKVTYEEYPIYLSPEESMAKDAIRIHKERDNVIADKCVGTGDVEKGLANADYVFTGTYATSIQQHVHMENQIAIAYEDEAGRFVCISSTQIPHICRRIVGQALGINWSKIRIKKPFIGGGFGNKQDVVVEPLAVAMSMACGGKPVKLALSREESLAYTRTRHKIDYKFKMGVTKDGKITTIDCESISNQGAYASHGHSVGGKGGGFINALYHLENLRFASKTVYTNIGVGGAMRGYGIPQVMFALESLIEDAARELGVDPFEFRKKNMVPEGKYNEITKINQFSNKYDLCLDKGREAFKWDEKLKAARDFKHPTKKRGVGIAGFSYGSGTYPYGLETAGARIILIQDGCFKLMIGATEIGQGSDTVFSQMAAETIGVPTSNIITDYMTDTDTAPFDTGAYASRQSYVTGMAVKEAAEEMRKKILELAYRVHDISPKYLNISDGNIVYAHNKQIVTSLADLAMISFYHMDHAKTIVSESSINCHENSYAYGVTLAEVEVDLEMGEIKILSIMNVHDSGVILNPLLATGQVEGGMAMAIGYGLNEELRYSDKGIPLNNNLLDYKILTTQDIPNLEVEFVESADPIGPYGNKSLGENPICSPAPAIRNAFLDATNIKINEIPLNSQRVFEHLKQAELI